MGHGYKLALFLLVFAATAAAQSSPTQEFQQTYPLPPSGNVFIRNVYGNVRITAWDRPEVAVASVKRASTRANLATAEVVVQHQANRLCIASKYGSARSLKEWFGVAADPCGDPPHLQGDRAELATVDYTISLPREAQAVVIVSDGDVDIQGITGGLYVDINKGHLTARDVAGDCKLFGSYSGVNVTLTKVPRDTHLTTAVGPLTVYLAPELSARIHAHANSGAVFNDFGWPRKPHEDLQAQLGSSGPLLDLTNFNGRVDIRRLQPPARAKAQVPKAH